MRLLVFSITFRPFIGGAEIALENIFHRTKSVDPVVITARLTRSLPEKEKQGRIMVYRVGKGRKLDKYLYVFYAVALAKQLHKEKPFVLQQAMMANYAGIAALFFKVSFPSVPYLLTLQSGDSSFFIWVRTFWFYPLYKKVYTKADRVQAISSFLMTRAKKYGYQGKETIIPNGASYEFFSRQKSTEEIAALKIELGIEPTEKVIITTSRLVYKNAVDQLILGFFNWRLTAKLSAKLLIVGSGKEEWKLRTLVKKMDMEKDVIFVGEKPYASLPLYLQMSDVFVRASRSEGMGNSFIEALAAGIPIVGTREGGIADFLQHKETGMVVDKDNPYAISRSIHELITNTELSETVVQQGRTLVQEKYDWDIIARQMEILYTELAKRCG